jgi:hypothetical protein
MVLFQLGAPGFSPARICDVFGAGLFTPKHQSPKGQEIKGAAMKVTIEMDMTPQEARAFMGLPDVAPLQEKMMDEMKERMRVAFDAGDPEGMMKAWMPLGGAEAFQKFQKLMWDSAAAMGKGGK